MSSQQTVQARRSARVSLWRTPRTRALLLVGCASIVAGCVALAARIFTDVLWFREVSHESVYWTTLRWRALAPAVTALGTTCFILANLAIVERRSASPPIGAPRLLLTLWPARRLVHVAVAIAAGTAGAEAQPDGTWKLLALWANRGDFGTSDPLFHRDAGFYVFSLPLYQQIAAWLLRTLVLAGAATVAAYAIEGGLRAARTHLLVLAAFGLALVGWRFRLDQFALALPHAGVPIPGASYTDVHVRLPFLRGLSVLALASAALCAWSAWRPVRLAVLVAPVALALVAACVANAVPGLFERLAVAPQALSRERTHVEAALTGTRAAFALDRIEVREHPGDSRLTPGDIEAHRRTLENVGLWDSSVLRPALNESQAIGGYYDFAGTTVDRYRGRVMTVAARRLDLTHLPPESRSWANTHFAYTHGYGVVAVHAGQTNAGRYPSFAQHGFGAGRLALTEPRIYFSERAALDPPFVITNSGRGEVEQPSPGSTPPAYHYDGDGGIAIGSLPRRVAFAVRFGDLKLALTETITGSSRILTHRDPRERLRLLAPFLEWDGHPQTVVAGGRVQFVYHGYTTSRSYPYAASVAFGDERVNYVRASVLAVVDAFDGRVTLYTADAGDPLVRAWAGVYPGLFTPLERLPAGLREHLRYPRRMFDAQAELYGTYHADDATGFWNAADAWQPARELAGAVERAGEVRFPDPGRESIASPGLQLATLPGERDERFMLTTSFTPLGRQNLVAYLAGSVGADGRARLTALSLPRDRLTTGPTQATRQVLADPAVDERLQILNRESRDLGHNSVNRTVLGTSWIVPVGDALVHVQAVYITAAGTGFPRLQLVTAYANGRVGSGPDVRSALLRAVR
jgi:uncharacterized membrane protein (UPF0182 family)